MIMGADLTLRLSNFQSCTFLPRVMIGPVRGIPIPLGSVCWVFSVDHKYNKRRLFFQNMETAFITGNSVFN